MMIALVLNVPFHFRTIRFAHGERAISILPLEFAEGHSPGFHPFRGARLDLLNHLGNSDGSRQIAENMDMVFHGADDNGRRIEMFENACHIAMQRFPEIIVDPRRPPLGAEDDVHEDFRK